MKAANEAEAEKYEEQLRNVQKKMQVGRCDLDSSYLSFFYLLSTLLIELDVNVNSSFVVRFTAESISKKKEKCLHQHKCRPWRVLLMCAQKTFSTR